MSRQKLPNLLTILRALLAFAFFLVLNTYRYPHGPDLALTGAFVVFIVASITDWLDGYLARKWDATSTFGRIMDPFCDKLLVLGALIYLAGPRFVDVRVAADAEGSFYGMLPGNMVSGVYPWMVAVILARELLVTGIRGELEGLGIQFGAKLSGKLKTILQMIIVPVLLVIIWVDPHRDGWGWLAIVRNVLVYATVIVTIASGIPYITGARRALKATRKEEAGTTPAPRESELPEPEKGLGRSAGK